MNKKLENLEKKFGMTTILASEFDEVADEFARDLQLTNKDDLLPAIMTEGDEIFSMKTLKQDFLLVRQNFLGLILKGQRLFDQSSNLELSELKASQIEALTNLQNGISANLLNLVSIYKTITEIEKLRQKSGLDPTIPQNVNMGSVTNNNIVFQGSPKDLLDMLKNKE